MHACEKKPALRLLSAQLLSAEPTDAAEIFNMRVYVARREHRD